ncbi:ATP-grasp domain-containing protein [Streptomyces sp. NPDC005408]|uniref:ATP-grasp domain-containing protein n=1 Tax=Streptomyces sp. NPDC005408 TaxID=3155341 RepID=UPI0033A507BE
MNRGQRPRLVIVAGTRRLLSMARELGAETVFVHARGGQIPQVAELAHHVIAADLSDADGVYSLLAPMHAKQPFSHVLSLTESGLLPAAQVAARLQVAGVPLSTVQALQDKRRMRALLNARGISPVRAAPVGSERDLAYFCREVEGPVVLKPATGTGSRAVFAVPGPCDAALAWRRFVRTGGEDAMAEEYLDGPEISIEAFSRAGRHTIIALTEKLFSSSFVELGHTVPASVPDDQQNQVRLLVQQFLDSVGLRDGPSHTEIRLTARGPRIVESHNRIGGDKIRELVHRVYGVDLVMLTAQCALGLPTPLIPPTPRCGAAVRFLAPSPGIIRRISIPDVPELTDGTATIQFDVAVGDCVGPVKESGDRSGYVLAEGADAVDAARRCERLAAQVVIDTQSAPAANTHDHG